MSNFVSGVGYELELSNPKGLVPEKAKVLPLGQHPPRKINFDSTVDMLDFIRANGRFWPKNYQISDARYDSSKHIAYYGTGSWSDALNLAWNGWPEGRRRLVHTQSREVPRIRQRSRARVYDVAGGLPDVPRFVSGDPFCMVDFLPADDGRKPVIRLCVSPNCDFSVSQERRENWGAALLSWIEAEESAGYQVELFVLYVTAMKFMHSHDRLLAPPLVVTCKLKGPSEDVILAELAFWLMHNAAHRRIQFAVKERFDVGAWYEYNPVHGEPVIDEAQLSVFAPQDAVVLSLNTGASSVEEGLAQIDLSVAAWRNRREAIA